MRSTLKALALVSAAALPGAAAASEEFQFQSIHGVELGMPGAVAVLFLRDAGYTFVSGDRPGVSRVSSDSRVSPNPDYHMHYFAKRGNEYVSFEAIADPWGSNNLVVGEITKSTRFEGDGADLSAVLGDLDQRFGVRRETCITNRLGLTAAFAMDDDWAVLPPEMTKELEESCAKDGTDDAWEDIDAHYLAFVHLGVKSGSTASDVRIGELAIVLYDKEKMSAWRSTHDDLLGN